MVDCERHQKRLVLGKRISWAVFEAGQCSARTQDPGQILTLPAPSCLSALWPYAEILHGTLPGCPQATVATVRCEAEATLHPLLFCPPPHSVRASPGWVWYRAAGSAHQPLLLLLTCDPPARPQQGPSPEGQGQLGCRQGCPRCQRRGGCSDLPAAPSEAKRCRGDRKPLSEQGQVTPRRDAALGSSPLGFQPGSPAERGAVTRGLG